MATQEELFAKLIPPRKTFFSEGVRRGYTITLEEGKSGATRFMKIERDGVGLRIEQYPFSYTLKNSRENLTTKAVNIAMMGEATMAVPQQWGPFLTVDSLDDLTIDSAEFPLIAKPNDASFSLGVVRNIATLEHARIVAKDIIHNFPSGAVLETQLFGDEFRLVFVEDELAGCVQRRHARVIGDGVRTIQALIEQRNEESDRGPVEDISFTCHPTLIDDEIISFLAKSGLTLESVPQKNHVVQITQKISAASGVDYVDWTDYVHEDYIATCRDFMKKYNCFVIGFDLITEDITKSPQEIRSGFNEFNISARLDLNENNNVGKKRPMAKVLWDHLEKHPDVFTENFDLH